MKLVEPIREISDIERIKLNLAKCPRDFLLFDIGINTGLRISDILNLKVKDVRNKEHLILIEKKTKKYKKILLMTELKKNINKYIKDKSNDTYLFKTRYTNTPISRIQAYRIINIACKAANIKENVGTHTLRKTFGYHFYQRTKDIVLLQNILNHSSPQVTLRYIGMNQDMIDNSLKNFYL